MDAATGGMPVHEVHAVEDREVPGPGGSIPVRVYRPSADAPLPILVWFHGGRLGHRIARYPRPPLPAALRRRGRDRRVGRLPPRARDEVPGRGRRLRRGLDVGHRARGRARRRPAPDRARRRQRRRQPRRGRRARRPRAGPAGPGAPAARVPGHRSRVRQPLDDRQRRRATSSRPRRCAGSSITTRARPADFADWRMSPLRAPDLAGLPPRSSSPPSTTRCAIRARRTRSACATRACPTQSCAATGSSTASSACTRSFRPREAWDTAIGALRAAFGTA